MNVNAAPATTGGHQRNPRDGEADPSVSECVEHSELVQQRIVQRPEQGVKETDHKGDVEPSMRRQKGDPQTEILDADQAARTPDGARASSKIDAKMDQGTLWSHEGEESHDADDRGHQKGQGEGCSEDPWPVPIMVAEPPCQGRADRHRQGEWRGMR